MPERYCVIPWTPDEQALASDKARYVGDGIAAVAAVDEETAIRALDAIKVDWEVLPAVFEPEDALAEDAPLVHEVDWKGRDRKNNICKTVDLNFGDVEQALSDADAVVEGTWFYEGNTHAPIEPHCAVGTWSPDDQLTVWSSTQVPHYLHRELAKVLDIPQAKVRVIQPALGGAFGGKSEPFDLEFCVALLSKKAGRPVKILYTREEVFYSHRGRHPMKMHFKVGATKDGKLTGVDSDILIDGGGYHSFGMITSYYAGQPPAGSHRLPELPLPRTPRVHQQAVLRTQAWPRLGPASLRLRVRTRPGRRADRHGSHRHPTGQRAVGRRYHRQRADHPIHRCPGVSG